MNAREATQLESRIEAAMAHSDLDRAEALAAQYRAAAGDPPANGDAARSPWFRAAYLAAQVALAAGRLEQALDRVTPLLPLTAELPAELACRVWLLAAEALARRQRLAEARGHLERARAAAPSLRRHPLLYLRELRIRLWLGEVTGLGAELSACARALEQGGDTANLALLACEEGEAWDLHGDLSRAGKCWHRAERLGGADDTDPIRARVLLHLGRLDHLHGRLQPALDRYEAALAYAGPNAPQALEVQLRRLLVLLDLNQASPACAHFRRLLDGVPPDEVPEEVRGLAALVAALLGDPQPAGGTAEQRGYGAAAAGDVVAARALYRQALAETAAPARRARLALALGMLAVAGGDRAEAAPLLREAEDLARKEELPEVLWRALQARGQAAAELDGDDDLARRLFEEAVLVSEGQARRLRHRTDAAAYHLHRAGVLQQLLRSACRRGDAAAVFRYQELQRGRLLLELWRGAGPDRPPLPVPPGLQELDAQLEECERVLAAGAAPDEASLRRRHELLRRRDQVLDDFLRDRSRGGSAALPALPELADLERALPPGTVYVAPSLAEDACHLLVVRPGEGGRVHRVAGPAAALRDQVEALRACVAAQLERYRRGFPLGRHERAELDGRLAELGDGPLGTALAEVRGGRDGPERLLWVHDDVLHGLPVHALRRGGRYLVEDHEVVYTFGGALFVHQARARRRRWWLPGPAVVVAESPAVLPAAAREGAGVAAGFARSRLLHGPRATRAAVRRLLPRARVVHFACHAYFDAEHPLAACIGLPSGESWRAVEWLGEPVDGLPLVTLSACRSAEVAPLVGREVFGLVTGLLGSGVRAVLAGLWPVADQETLPLMWQLYRHRLTHDLAGGLARAQREALAAADSSPLFWAAFALFGDAGALPAPGPWGRWWARRRQHWHARRFPVAENLSPEWAPAGAPKERSR
jgi:tetratricopeptide (TPR) repeat protein